MVSIPHNAQVGDVLYRATASAYWSEDGHVPRVVLDLEHWSVHKLTSHGAWLGRGRSRKPSTWRSFTTKFVWPTEEEAEESLKRRTFARLDHARRRVDEAKAVMAKLGLDAKQPWNMDL